MPQKTVKKSTKKVSSKSAPKKISRKTRVVEEDSAPDTQTDNSPIEATSYSVPEKKNPYFTYVLSALLIVAAFFIGNLYTRVKLMEQGGAGKTGGTAVPAAADAQQAGNLPKADLKVEDADPVMGEKDAKVTVVVFADFQCPFCGALEGKNKELVDSMTGRDPNWKPAIPNIIQDYVQTGKAKLVWKDYPFLGDESFWAAEAAHCAGDQGKFWEYHNTLFSNQKGENQGAFSKNNLKKFAGDIGLDITKFNACFDGGTYTTKMKNAMAYGQGVGVSGTPATFVNGTMISGAAGYQQFKDTIEEELKK